MGVVGGLEEMIERTFVFSDIHYPDYDKSALIIAEKILKDFKPHRVIYIGDMLNMTPVSHWLDNTRRPLEGQRLLKDYDGFINLSNKHLRLSGSQLKEVVYMEGNHCKWIEQYLDKHPEMEGMIEVKDKVIDVIAKKNPRLDVKWIPYNDFYKVGKLYFTHGIYANQHHASKHVATTHRNIVYGHTHTVQQFTDSNIVDGEKHMAKSIGCLCSLSPSYMKNKPNQWVHAVSLVYTDKGGNFNEYTVIINQGKAIYNNKLYRR